MAKAKIGDVSMETKSVDLGHPDAAQPAPTRDASGDASNPAPVTQDLRYLIYYVWSDLPPAEKPADIVLSSLKDTPVGTPVEGIKRASDAFGLDFNFMKAVARIEFGFDPKQRTGSYIGLFQRRKTSSRIRLRDRFSIPATMPLQRPTRSLPKAFCSSG